MSADLFAPMTFARGEAMPNRFMLAPLTNQQSPSGLLSDEERNWLLMRGRGGFGLVMTAAAYVQPNGKGFPGQIGIDHDGCVPALASLAAELRAQGCRSSLQLYHAGIRACQPEIEGPPVGPSEDAASGARAMTTGEVEAMIEAFIAAALRAQEAGFDGVEIHGAHGYLLCAFLSPEHNHRTDRFGGSLANRASPLREVIAGIRARCRPDFTLGVRLTVERMGIVLAESRQLVGELMAEGQLDYIDLSLWDVFMTPVDPDFAERPLIGWFTDLPRGGTRLGVAGKIRSGAEARQCLEAGADFVLIGRAAIANHDFPRRIADNPDFEMPALPLPRAHVAEEGATAPFLAYLGGMPGLLEPA
ncbi:NADH:flavin oxidoreductase [Novosphingobium bradum]|uniref:NADH:flavin oxidoreductase n=1 Tax=Novosphingobium bradum TaxID=1737444 RepID=A0ABV7IPW7_9SPHN